MYARGHPSGAWRQPVVPVCSAVQVYMFWRVRFTPKAPTDSLTLLLAKLQPACNTVGLLPVICAVRNI